MIRRDTLQGALDLRFKHDVVAPLDTSQYEQDGDEQYWAPQGAFLRSVCLMLLVILCQVSPALSAPFRQQGNEFIEIQVMESDAILDVNISSLESGTVRDIVFDTGVFSLDITKGTRVMKLRLPSFDTPLFESSAKTAKVSPVSHRSHAPQIPGRILLFVQTDPQLTAERFGLPFVPEKLTREEYLTIQDKPYSKLRARFLFGDAAYYWATSSQTAMSVSDETWSTFALVQDLVKSEYGFQVLQQQVNAALTAEDSPDLAKRLSVRRYMLPQDLQNWGSLLKRIYAAVDYRERFFRLTQGAGKKKKQTFYLSILREERVYSNYALEELEKLGGKSVGQELLKMIPHLRIFVDDAYEKALSVLAQGRESEILEVVSSFVERLENGVINRCVPGVKPGDIMGSNFDNGVNPMITLPFRLVSLEKVYPLLVRLYEAELKCYLRIHSIDPAALLLAHGKTISRAGLQALRSGALTKDELGVLETSIEVKNEQVKVQEEHLKNFTPKYSLEAITQLARSPKGRLQLLEHCRRGLEEYEKLALPDHRYGTYYIWAASCQLLKEYHWPDATCSIRDSRARTELEFMQALSSKLIQSAIEHNDIRSLRSALGLLKKQFSPWAIDVLVLAVQESFEFFGQSIHSQFLKELPSWPELPLAWALARQYQELSSKKRLELDAVLSQLTGAKYVRADEKFPEKKWIEYLTALESKTVGNAKPVLPNPEAIKRVLTGSKCEEMINGWTQLWRKEAELLLKSEV